MNDLLLGLLGLLCVLVGFALGAFFFGGLWWTVRRVVGSKQPAPWLLGSLLVRTSVTLTGIYWVSGGRVERILACMVGFVAARAVVTRLTGSLAVPGPSSEARHAP